MNAPQCLCFVHCFPPPAVGCSRGMGMLQVTVGGMPMQARGFRGAWQEIYMKSKPMPDFVHACTRAHPVMHSHARTHSAMPANQHMRMLSRLACQPLPPLPELSYRPQTPLPARSWPWPRKMKLRQPARQARGRAATAARMARLCVT